VLAGLPRVLRRRLGWSSVPLAGSNQLVTVD